MCSRLHQTTTWVKACELVRAEINPATLELGPDHVQIDADVESLRKPFEEAGGKLGITKEDWMHNRYSHGCFSPECQLHALLICQQCYKVKKNGVKPQDLKLVVEMLTARMLLGGTTETRV